MFPTFAKLCREKIVKTLVNSGKITLAHIMRQKQKFKTTVSLSHELFCILHSPLYFFSIYSKCQYNDVMNTVQAPTSKEEY